MQHRLRHPITDFRILKTVLIFFLAYAILLILWWQAREAYTYGLTFVASKVVAELKDAQLEKVTKENDIVMAYFHSSKGGRDLSVALPVKMDVYVSNLPLTLAMLASLYPFIRKRQRAYTEALLVLLLFHFSYIFFWEAMQMTTLFMAKGIEGQSLTRLSLYHFLWGASNYASVSFVPFLVVTYIFIRFRR